MIGKTRYILPLLLFALPGKATENIAPWYKPGDTLNVLALSGLKIRETPSKQGKVLATLNYADQVIVQNDAAKQVPYKVEELKGFFIEGYWVKVVSNGKEGYVFDGFLSSWAAPERNLPDEEMEKWNYCEDFGYFKKTLKTTSKPILSKTYNDENDCDFIIAKIKSCHWKQNFSQGVSFEYNQGEGGYSIKTVYKNITLREAYQITVAMQYDKNDQVIEYDPATKTIVIKMKEEGAGCGSDIHLEKNGTVIVDHGCGC